jgi:hypothetical protein
MQATRYNAAITIQAATGFKFATRQDMDPAKGRLFIEFVGQQLDIINGWRIGPAFFRALKDTQRTVTIWLDGDRNGSAAVMAMDDAANDRARFFKPIRPPSQRVLSGWAKLDRKPAAPPGGWQRAVARGPYLEELSALLDRAANGGLKRPMVASLLGLAPEALKRLENGELVMSDDVHFKLAFYLYPWLTPGPGIHTAVRFDAAALPKHDGPKPEAEWGAPVPAVNLGHELIHCLRMMQGMRVAEGMWGEESMTVGLPPFTTLPFTENKFRVEAGVAVRTQYGQSSTGAKSAWLDQLAADVETGGATVKLPAKPAPASGGWVRANPRSS